MIQAPLLDPLLKCLSDEFEQSRKKDSHRNQQDLLNLVSFAMTLSRECQ